MASSSEVQVYDFKRPERVSKEQIIALETLHEIFARNLSASLSGYLRAVVEAMFYIASTGCAWWKP